VNLLRVWGGGLLERELFYELCDRFGIMVWQEFPQAGSRLDSRPDTDEDYLSLVHELAPQLLARRRNHPSLVLWCGGDELTHDDGTPLTSEHPTLAALKQAVDLDDPQRLWLPTSPSGPTFSPDPAAPGRTHDGHGPWTFLGALDHYRYYNGIDPLLHSSFGVEGPANPETVARFQGEQVEALFGSAADLPTFVWAGQFLQAEGLRYAVEANRRRKWRCSGTLPWQFNEPWPNAIGTSAVDYYGQTKPAYEVVRRAYRPFHVSAAYETIAWHGRTEFVADVWLHNAGEARELLNVVATIADVGGQVFAQENLAAEAPAEAAENAGDLRWRLPNGYAGVFVLFLQVVDEEGQILAENAYLHSAAPDPPFAPLLTAPRTRLEVIRERGDRRPASPTTTSGRQDMLTIRNTGDAFALGVRLHAPADHSVRFGDNYLILPPGEERTVTVSTDADAVRVTGWNVDVDA
jgi:beta-mannosidase